VNYEQRDTAIVKTGASSSSPVVLGKRATRARPGDP